MIQATLWCKSPCYGISPQNTHTCTVIRPNIIGYAHAYKKKPEHAHECRNINYRNMRNIKIDFTFEYAYLKEKGSKNKEYLSN